MTGEPGGGPSGRDAGPRAPERCTTVGDVGTAETTGPPAGPSSGGGGGARRPRPLAAVAMRRLWVVGASVIVLQLAGLLAWSWHLWTRFDLTADMATFSQAF